MKPFTYAAASSLEDVVGALDEGCRPLAGGTDLLGLMKTGIRGPERLVSLKSIEALEGVERREDGWRIGALTTLSELASPARGGEQRELEVLSRAAAESASPQLRNAATIGGNLLQWPRCWYFRNWLTRCWLKGGDRCLAAGGENRYHAILGAARCHMVHPSDPAVALAALDARVELRGVHGVRTLKIDAFFGEPKPLRENGTVVERDEVITAVVVPRPSRESRGAYVKLAERKVWDFALVSAAVQIEMTEGAVTDAAIVLGGVAAKPWHAFEAEGRLVGEALTGTAMEAAASAATAGAVSLSQNGYKIELAEGAVREALRRLQRTFGSESTGVG